MLNVSSRSWKCSPWITGIDPIHGFKAVPCCRGKCFVVPPKVGPPRVRPFSPFCFLRRGFPQSSSPRNSLRSPSPQQFPGNKHHYNYHASVNLKTSLKSLLQVNCGIVDTTLRLGAYFTMPWFLKFSSAKKQFQIQGVYRYVVDKSANNSNANLVSSTVSTVWNAKCEQNCRCKILL